jgi:DNA ligase-1
MNHTMNSDQIFEAIESIAKTSGKNDKIAMVKALIDCPNFLRVMKASLDNTISYGIKAVPERTMPGAGQFDDGTWGIIVEMRNRNLTGSAMQAAVQEEINRLGESSSQLFKRILLKDLRAGFSDETVNKVAPGSLPEFPYQRCSLPKDAKPEVWDQWGQGHISQEKADGMFANVDHEDTDEVFIYSRQGSMFPMGKFANLEHSIKSALKAGTQSHGEMLVVRDGVVLAREIGNGVLNSVLKGGDFADNEHPVFMVWDQIPLTEVRPKGKYNVPYFERLKDLVMQMRGAQNDMVRLIPTKIVKSLPEAYDHAGEIMKRGGEGTILKRRTAIWKDGTSKEQVKLKLEFTVDLMILAVVPGRENTKNAGRAGSLKCITRDALLEVDVAIKGEKMRDAVDANLDDWIGRIMPVTANLVLKPSESNEKHSLFLPRFAESDYRTDKVEADSLQRVFDQEEAAKLGVAILKAAA